MSRQYDTPPFIVKCFYDKGDQEGDDDHGYHRLDLPGRNLHSTKSYGTSTSASRSWAAKKGEAYTEVDAKGKRLSTKLRRKEVRKRVGHALHSTWKWLKRGVIAVAPTMTSMFMFSPAAVFTFAPTTPRRS